MDYAELQEKFPFLSCIKYANNEYVGILQNQDQYVTTIYVYDDLKDTDLKQEFLDFGEIWWWESNRTIPINIFLSKEFSKFKDSLKSFTTKDVEVMFGPATSLNNVMKKRIIRRNISLIKKTTNS
ncbi:MAG: hypothetical protein CBC05_02005 [Crocinitomicaceae bacterium TMED45]|nr:MAG: hypothetical protein CBC05_02005 [Crocinitomicaceae bacterium TMED45]RPG88441.1 MAG: hypothetical protein CBD69_000365 [Crocinitomicaceae bacterium TMED209]|tara:strand:+ start:7446 stop:7820 length:375 start_codon:yes stop_codon:yes gene_type:complete